MKILIISLYYFPEPVSKPHDLASVLTKFGNEVKVLTGYPNYPYGKLYPGYKNHVSYQEALDGIQVIRIKHFIDHSKSALRRILSYFSFTINSIVIGNINFFKLRKPDLIWTYQIGLPGFILSKMWKVPHIHEVQDLWPDWGRTAKIGLMNFLYKILETQEKIIYNHASCIVTITRRFEQILANRVKDPKKIIVIPNWANENFLDEFSTTSMEISNNIFTNFFNILYVGNIGTAQGLIFLVGAASLLKEYSDIRITIIGDGVERVSMENNANQEGLMNIRFLGSLPQDEASKYMKVADVLFIHLKDDPVYDITIPSKTYGYLAAKRPILAAVRGELANLINENKVGLVCPPEDSQAIADAIIKLKNLPREELDKMGLSGYKLVTNNFTREILGKKYVDLFEEILEKRKGKKS